MAIAATACGIVAVGFQSTACATTPVKTRAISPKQRLLGTWLDIQLVSIFYPDTRPRVLARNLSLVAARLGQPRLVIRHGSSPRDTMRFAEGTVLIKSDTPAGTLVMFARSQKEGIYKLVEHNGLKVFRVRKPSSPALSA